VNINLKLGSLTIQVPAFDLIPVPKTRAALEQGIELTEAKKQTERDIREVDTALLNAKNSERIRLGDAYAAGNYEDPEDMGEEVAALEHKLKLLRSRLRAFAVAEVKVATTIREAIAEEAELWAKSARREAQKVLTQLTTAARMASDAQAGLEASLGMLGGLQRFALEREAGGAGNLARQYKPYGYYFDLEPAVKGLRESIGKATSELRDLS
jgi:hypothetical protein